MAAPKGSIILEEEFDKDYEPTEQEILEYATFLDMDVENEKDLFWIARDSLKCPLPADWKPCQTEDGNVYYFNFKTGQSIWDHPCDEHYRKLYAEEKQKWLAFKEVCITKGRKLATPNLSRLWKQKYP